MIHDLDVLLHYSKDINSNPFISWFLTLIVDNDETLSAVLSDII